MDEDESSMPRLVVRCPEDLLAVVPVTLGFHPEESLVLLSIAPVGSFHARVDLPPTPDGLRAAIEALLGPVVRHRVTEVVLVGYSARRHLVRQAVAAGVRALRRAGVRVRDGLMVCGDRWYPALPGVSIGPGTHVDPAVHPFLLEAVVEGRVVHRSRAELRGSIAADPRRVEPVVARLAARSGGEGPGEAQRAAEVAWLQEAVQAALGEGSLHTPERVARLLAALTDQEAADEIWFGLTRANARAHVDLWSSVLPAAPAGWVAAPAALLACAAWLTGDGALAWCAIDRCLEDQPGHELALALAHALENAVPPSVWAQRPPRSRDDPA